MIRNESSELTNARAIRRILLVIVGLVLSVFIAFWLEQWAIQPGPLPTPGMLLRDRLFSEPSNFWGGSPKEWVVELGTDSLLCFVCMLTIAITIREISRKPPSPS